MGTIDAATAARRRYHQWSNGLRWFPNAMCASRVCLNQTQNLTSFSFSSKYKIDARSAFHYIYIHHEAMMKPN